MGETKAQVRLRIFCLILIKLVLAYFNNAEKFQLIIAYNLCVIIDYFRMMVLYGTIFCPIFDTYVTFRPTTTMVSIRRKIFIDTVIKL